MPAYISHTLMARDVYNKLDNDVNLNYMITFSLGGDLCKYSKCRKDSHNIKQKEFIYNMADYLKENNLKEDPILLGVLYGHICHYIMDDMLHPLIRNIDKYNNKNKNNHTLIEGYYDNYLLRSKLNTTVDRYDNRVLFKGKVNKNVSNMINYAYKKTYDTNNVSLYYKFNLFLYKKIKYLYKIFKIETLKKYSGFNEFNDNNRSIDLLNYGTVSLDSLYNESVTKALEYIEEINKYLKYY